MNIASPCTGICKLDETTNWCLGCGRDGHEIADWRKQPEAWRRAIWDEIPARLGQMGVACHRLPWMTEDVRSFVLSTLAVGKGTWVMGVVGAVAEFTAAPGQQVSVREDGEDIVGHTFGGALRMRINDDVRALTFDPQNADRPPRIVLAVKRERGKLGISDQVKALGQDSSALINEEANALYDLGLGRKEARFCVRVSKGPAQQSLEAAVGLSFVESLPKIGSSLIAESPTRVVETALGRLEVQGAIPPPDARSPEGPHTHLLPDHLATGRALPVGMDLPPSYLPGAIYYPPR